jgi:hypothetical protein
MSLYDVRVVSALYDNVCWGLKLLMYEALSY